MFLKGLCNSFGPPGQTSLLLYNLTTMNVLFKSDVSAFVHLFTCNKDMIFYEACLQLRNANCRPDAARESQIQMESLPWS